MQALVLTAYQRLELGDVPEPSVGRDEVLIAVEACGICGSDVHGLDGSTGRRQPPLIMGHEAAGRIVKVGAGVSGWQVGDRVTFDSTIFCGECASCRAGRRNLCAHRQVIGVACDEYRRQGAFAELISVPSRVLYRLPESLPYEHAAMAEPVSVALHAVSRAAVRPGDRVVVLGAGLIGLFVIQALKLRGAGQVIAVDKDERRLELARRLGADHVIEAGPDLVPEILAASAEDGADVAIEVVGVAVTTQAAVRCVRKGGTVCCVGNLAPEVPFPIQLVVTREINVVGSYGSAGEYAAALDAIAAGTIQVAPVLSAVADLREGADWFRRLYDNREGLLKVVLRP